MQSTERARACARVVLPTPGTSSISRWPRASRQTSERRTTSGLPRIVDCRADSSSASFKRNCGETAIGGASIVSRWAIKVIILFPEVETEISRRRESLPRTSGRVAQLVRAPASHAGGHRFESCRAHHSKQIP